MDITTVPAVAPATTFPKLRVVPAPNEMAETIVADALALAVALLD